MTEVSEAAKLKACELANEQGLAGLTNWTPERVVNSVFGVALAREIQRFSDAAKEVQQSCAGRIDTAVAAQALDPFILPDPVDPLLIEARELCANMQKDNHGNESRFAHEYRMGIHDGDINMRLTLIALKRGMELADQSQADWMKHNIAPNAEKVS